MQCCAATRCQLCRFWSPGPPAQRCRLRPPGRGEGSQPSKHATQHACYTFANGWATHVAKPERWIKANQWLAQLEAGGCHACPPVPHLTMPF